MVATSASKRAVFQTIADIDEKHWPYYRCPSKEYAANDLDALKHDVSTLAQEWFQHDAHDDAENFICICPLAHFEFASYDTFPDWHAQPKPLVPMLRALMLMHLHGWEHETPLVTYLDEQEGLADALGFESVPSQTTLWRARHERFSQDLRRSVKQCADFVQIHTAWNRVLQRIDPEQREEYLEAHENVPDGVSEAMHRGGVTEFELYFHEDIAVCILECDDLNTYLETINDDGAVEEWERFTAGLSAKKLMLMRKNRFHLWNGYGR